MFFKNLICFILLFFNLTDVNCQETNILFIHTERINQIIHTINAIDKPNINNYLDLFSVNNELEKGLFMNKKISEGINEVKADSIFDWVVMQNRDKNESLVLNRLKNYLSPICNFSIGRIKESNDSYTIYEVSVTLKSKENRKIKYYFEIGKIPEEKYPIINIYDSKLISIITGKPKGYCY
jgi:hypothetical protein